MKVFKCAHCGKVVIVLSNEQIPTICCGEAMKEVLANTVDAAHEKHVPVVAEENNKVFVKIGEVEHPMTLDHLIEWVVVHTDQGYKMKRFKAGDKPEATFALLDNEIALEVYGYCNLHGLWKSTVE